MLGRRDSGPESDTCGYDALDLQRVWHIFNSLSFVVGEDGFENV